MKHYLVTLGGLAVAVVGTVILSPHLIAIGAAVSFLGIGDRKI